VSATYRQIGSVEFAVQLGNGLHSRANRPSPVTCIPDKHTLWGRAVVFYVCEIIQLFSVAFYSAFKKSLCTYKRCWK
jgi:hypothetical protein